MSNKFKNYYATVFPTSHILILIMCMVSSFIPVTFFKDRIIFLIRKKTIEIKTEHGENREIFDKSM